MAVVVFDPADFREKYPAFSDTEKYTDARLTEAFEMACLILSNAPDSIVPYDPDREIYTRRTLLYLLMCHILTLWGHDYVGAVTSATEGSVSVSLYVPQNINAAWFTQTPCGAAYWQAILPYRTGPRYVPYINCHNGF